MRDERNTEREQRMNLVAAVQVTVCFEDGVKQTFAVSPGGIVERVLAERDETRPEAMDAINSIVPRRA